MADAMERAVVSDSVSQSTVKIRCLLSDCRAIIIVWIIVTFTAIPVLFNHGVVEYTDHKNEINTACLFLTEENNHALFQVRHGKEKLIIS